MFQGEARFGRISDLRRCWAPLPVRPRCRGMLIHKYTYAYAAVDVLGALEDPLSDALLALEQDTPRVQSMVARDWIINALLKQKLS